MLRLLSRSKEELETQLFLNDLADVLLCEPRVAATKGCISTTNSTHHHHTAPEESHEDSYAGSVASCSDHHDALDTLPRASVSTMSVAESDERGPPPPVKAIPHPSSSSPVAFALRCVDAGDQGLIGATHVHAAQHHNPHADGLHAPPQCLLCAASECVLSQESHHLKRHVMACYQQHIHHNSVGWWCRRIRWRSTTPLKHITTHVHTLQHIATHCNTLYQHVVYPFPTIPHRCTVQVLVQKRHGVKQQQPPTQTVRVVSRVFRTTRFCVCPTDIVSSTTHTMYACLPTYSPLFLSHTHMQLCAQILWCLVPVLTLIAACIDNRWLVH